MNARALALRVVAVGSGVLTVLLYIGLVVLAATPPALKPPDDLGISGVMWPLPFIAFSLIGTLLAVKRPDNLIAWLFCGSGLLMTSNGFTVEYAYHALEPGSALPGAGLAAWLGTWTWLTGFGLIPLIFLLFPTGAPPSRRWRHVVIAAVILHAAVLIGAALLWPRRGLEMLQDTISKAEGAEFIRVASNLVFALVFVGAWSLVARFRRSSGDERAQLKWVALATCLIAGGLTSAFIAGGDDPIQEPLVAIIIFGSVTTLPAAAAVAVLKYRLYDIDVIINKALVYSILTGLLALTYAGGIVIFRQVVPLGEDSDVGIAASTLAVAGAFGPARTRIQRFIDRRFYRSRYDAARVLDDFAGTLRQEVNLRELEQRLLEVVGGTVQPERASLWLRNQEPAT